MSKTVCFTCFKVDLRAGELYKRGARIHLRDKSFQALTALLEHPGEVVTRDELRRRLWPDDVTVDFDNNLNTAIARLRLALGDSAGHPRYIETLLKHGYRFMPAVIEQSPPAAPVRVAVLPFVNLSGDPAHENLSDAMTDDLITGLAALAPGRLAVIARTTAMRYKGTGKDVAQIGRELGVEYVVEGGVHGATERITLNVQLVRVSNQMDVFASHYDAELGDILTMQDRVARALAGRLLGDRTQETT